MLKAKSAVKDNVAEGLQKEVARLQQYTRRYSVTIAGVKKPANEKPEIPKPKGDSSVKNDCQPEPSKSVDQKPTDPKPSQPKPAEKSASTEKPDEKIQEEIPEEKTGT